MDGDKVIQIGTVFHRYGDSEPYKRHILVIAPTDNLPDEEICADLDNIEVVRCKCELDLLLAWTKLIKEIDPEWIHPILRKNVDFLIRDLTRISRIEITRLSKSVII